MELSKIIKIEYLSGNQREIAEVIGMEAYIRLVTYYGGNRIDVAYLSSVLTNAVKKEIVKENFSEENIPELARALNLSYKDVIRLGK